MSPPESRLSISDALPPRRVKAEDLFRKRKRKEITTLGGMTVNLRVPVYELQGQITLEGDVPDEALLFVRNGSLRVEGYVYGHLYSAGPIQIQGNAQGGLIVSAGGHIDVGRVLTGCRLVAQMGGISCQEVESARLLFARRGIMVQGNVRGGRLYGQNITVVGEVSHAELHAIGPILAEAFRVSAAGATVICLRRSLTSESYGRTTSTSATELRFSMAREKRRIPALERRIQSAEKDVVNCRRTMLYYMFVGAEERGAVSALRGAQTRAKYLAHLVEISEILNSFLRATADSRDGFAMSNVEAVEAEYQENLRIVSDGITSVPAEFRPYCDRALSLALRQCTNAFKGIRTNLEAFRRAGDGAAPSYLQVAALMKNLDALEKHLQSWRGVLEEAENQSWALVTKLNLDSSIVKKVEANQSELEEMLNVVLAEARRQPKSIQAGRANSSFIRLMQGTVERQERDAARFRRELTAARRRLEEARANLERDPSFVLAEEEEHEVYAQARRFDSGVVVTSIPGVVEPPKEGKGTVVRIDSAVDGQVRYCLRGGLIRKENAPKT